jgi:asparagine synthase (glutamine-hydrolysing)
MFRYIALAWEPTAPDAVALAHALAASFRAHPQWQTALMSSTLCVFTTGAVAGINDAYRLHDGRGVVLGRLFDRQHVQASTQQIARQLDADDEVITSGGGELLDRYWGRYVAFLEPSDGKPQVIRDPSGTLPCFVLRHRGVTVVFSWLEDILSMLPQIPVLRVSRDGVAAYMAFGDLTGRCCALEGVTQVLAGERLVLERAGQFSGELAWDGAEIARQPHDMVPADAMAAMTAVRDTVANCVQAWASCYGSILLRLSGGVDSSILASCLAEGRTPCRVTALNYHSIGSDSDEREFARQAATMARMELIECRRDSSFRLDRILDVARTPVPCDYVGRIASSTDAELAESLGALAMFSGAGGDQLFFEVRQWWPVADYLRLRGFDAGLPGAALDAARLGKVSVWRALRLAIADRFRRRPPALDQHRHFTLFSDAVRHQAQQPAGFVHPVFLTPTTLPIGKLMQVQQLAGLSAYYDPLTRDKAPEFVAPLLSQPLIELCLRLPTFVLIHGGRGRGLARSAFEGAIPSDIARRRSKGGMDEHVRAVLAHNLDFARAMLLDGELVRLGLIDRAATEAALSAGSARKPHASEIHVCIAVEAWLRRWPRVTRQAA